MNEPNQDKYKGHVVVPIPDTEGIRSYVKWKCERCKERSSDKEYFEKYQCYGEPDFV